jgi:hypothetical protein
MPILAIAMSGLALTVGTASATSAPGSGGAKKAAKCQQTIGKANAKFLSQRLKRLAACSTAVLGCLQTAAGDAACLAKASGKCRKQLGDSDAPDALADAVEEAVVKACGALPAADLLDVAALGFSSAAATCAGVGVSPLASAADVARCLRRVHAGVSEQSLGVEVPRAAELAAQGGVEASRVPDLPLFGGCGGCGTAPLPAGKAVAACAVAINKAGGGFLASTRAGLDKCTGAFIKCAQEKPGDAGCFPKAVTTCRKLPASLAKARAKLRAALQKKCSGGLPFDGLQAEAGINLGALACACQQVGVGPVTTLDDYAVCLARHHECELAALLPTVAPGLDALLATQGVAVSDLLCESPSAPLLVARAAPRAFAPPFGTITKYMSGVFPAKLTTTRSPVSTRGTPPRVGAPSSSTCSPAPGRTCTFRFPISKKPTTLKRAARGEALPPTLIVGVHRLDGEFVDDHFELELGDTSTDSEVELQVTYADDLAGCDFELALSVMEDGAVASYTAIEQQPHVPPTNDECAASRMVTENPFFEVLDTTAATLGDIETPPSCALGSIGRSVWYQVTAPGTGILSVSTVGSDYDTVVAVREETCDGSELACVDDSGLPQSVAVVPVTAGTDYLIRVAERGTPAATSALHLTLAFVPLQIGTPPTISNLVLGTPEVNSPLCDIGVVGTAFPMTIDYADPTGNVQPDAVAALVLEHFEPSQREEYGIPTEAPVVTGDGFSGTVSFGVCAFFGTDTIVSFKVTLLTLVTLGLPSNQLIGALPKPPGAN